MKKIFVLMFAAAMFVSFQSCKKDAQKVEDAATEAVQKVEDAVEDVVDAVVPEIKPADALKAFQDYSKAYGEAFNRRDYATLSKLGKTFNEELKKIQPFVKDFNAKQKKDYDFSLNILKEVNTQLSGGK
jgi:Asp-tRNA(Asn)/Glu-tRNA(Gln) amidotransferase A subunit family amidase